MTFQEWLDWIFYPDFDASGLSDAEYYALEDEYYAYTSEDLVETVDEAEEVYF